MARPGDLPGRGYAAASSRQPQTGYSAGNQAGRGAATVFPAASSTGSASGPVTRPSITNAFATASRPTDATKNSSADPGGTRACPARSRR